MEGITRVVGPLSTNVTILADERTREAIAIDTAIPSLAWIQDELAARQWTLRLIVNTHGHWDHMGDNAAIAEHTGAQIAIHPADRYRLESPSAKFAPFPIPPSIAAVDLAEGGEVRFGKITLQTIHTPGHTEGSVCLWNADEGIMFSGDTLFAGGWGRVDLPGGNAEQMVESLGRLATFEDRLQVIPGHGQQTTIGRERAWLELVQRHGRLLF